MNPSRRITRLALAVLLTASTATLTLAQEAARQPDVPYVPTPQDVVDRMLDMASFKPGDVHYDLGCGDGRIVISAAKRGAKRAVGVDINPERIRESNDNAKTAGVTDKVKFVIDDLFVMDFKDADVVTLYLLPAVNVKLRPRLLDELRPGTRIVSHDFDMEDWVPDQETTVDGDEDEGREHRLYLWIIPAKLAGTWDVTLPQNARATLQLDQKFQTPTGTLAVTNQSLPLQSAKVTGASLHFTTSASRNGTPTETTYEATLTSPDTLQGTARVKDGPTHQWSAKRRPAGPAKP